MDRLHVLRIRVDPTQVDLGLAQRFVGILPDPLHEVFALLPALHLPRPCTQDGLVEQVFFIVIGRQAAVFHLLLEFGIHALPAVHGRRP